MPIQRSGCTIRVLACILGVMLAMSCAGQARITLKVAMWQNTPEDAAVAKKMLDEYEKQNPNVKLEFIYTPWGEYHGKMLTLVAAGLAPDVMVVERRFLPSFASQGIVVPVDEYVKNDKSLDIRRDLTEIKSGIYQGKFYGIPIWGGPAVLRFNVEMFDEAGVPSPLDYAKRENWNWSTFVDAGRKLTRDKNGDGKVDQVGLEGISSWQPDWVAKIRQNGGDVLNEDGTKCIIDSREAIEALQFWQDLRHRYKITDGSFEQGKAGMGYVWVQEAERRYEICKKLFTMDLAPMPAGKAGYVHIAGACPVCISKSTRYPEEAYKLAKWLAYEEGKHRGFPAFWDVFREMFLKRTTKLFTDPAFVVKVAMSNAAPEPVVHLKGPELESAWNPILGDLASGKISAEVAALRMKKVTDEILKKK